MGSSWKYKEIEVGELYESKYWGKIRILDASDQNSIVFEFLNTGNVRVARKQDIVRGNIRDKEALAAGVKMDGYIHPLQQEAIIPAGQQFKSNLYGVVEVVEYITSKDILVKFLDTGNIQSVQKHALLNGLIHDLKLKADNTEAKLRAAAENREKRQQKIEEQRNLKMLQKQQQREERQIQKSKIKEAAEKQKQEEDNRLIGYTAEDRFGHTFTVISHVRGKNIWKVKYLESGNEYEVKEGWMLKGSIGDFNRPDYDELAKSLQASRAAISYEKNRKQRIKKASDYQKENKEKTNTRNRNRRARRLQAEGSHTLEEIAELLKEQDNRCACCGYDISDDRHLDHIMPLALGGSNYIENLQWLCSFCNLSKNDRHPDDWEKYRTSEIFLSRLALRKSSAGQYLQ